MAGEGKAVDDYAGEREEVRNHVAGRGGGLKKEGLSVIPSACRKAARRFIMVNFACLGTPGRGKRGRHGLSGFGKGVGKGVSSKEGCLY